MLLGLAALGALIVVVLVVILPVYFTVIKKHNSSASSSGGGGATGAGGGGGGSPGSSPGSKAAITGGDGSTITMDNGSNFTYSNAFGGSWYYDPEDPFNNNAQVNSWTPPLNTSWNFSTDQIRGVNIGGLFVLEPFISPALFQAYPDAIDEWSLSEAIAANTSTTLQAVLEDHYNTFITEEDIAQIAGAGLNWIRVPIPYWAIETWEGEPFLEGVSWKYIVRLLGWARKYGLRVNLDLHTIPGSQNAFNHSGKFGIVNFLNGVMGVANAQRALNYIRIITEFISEPEWADVVPIFGVVNEALLNTIGREQLNSFYLETHNMMRNITGVGAGKGPYMSVHDGFQGVATWAGFMPGSDRVILDSHPYTAFYGSSEATIASGTNPASAGGTWPKTACTKWGNGFNASRSSFGVTIAGEMSAGFNDCGLFLRGVNVPPTTTNCGAWQDSSKWSAATKAGVMQFTLASMDALQDYFFWTWKIGNSTAGIVESPLWSYQLGLQEGWIPTDPRTAVGKCAAVGVSGAAFDGTYLPWQTGGAGAGTISATWSSSYGVYPPATISNAGAAASALPQYTSTGTVATLVPPPTLTASATASAVSAGNGWFDASDTAGGVTAIAGCTYPNAWSAVSVAVPTLCGAKTGAALAALATPPPKTRRELD
ncbi:glycoside hydrolase family 5 protein [Athelia psychrophila]|uniref:glucan 1,3-beta-glucosidase n=1 Tax=Athelia psychrophila TaxID=1759441 RepID=A0A166L8I6_9AGAM|nr:glycoside hydrolase family 5 protein [Fibularhizoctonia sp. CBS 109695]